MSDTTGENAAVEQLLAERDALHGWLERLDAASVAASTAVRDRVRRDYQQRLDQLTNALREHGDTIAEKLSADQGEFAELTARTEASSDELAEVELRYAVGEFPADRYDTERRRHQSDIETFELSLAAVRDRIARMEEVLAHVRRAPRAPELPLDDAPQAAVSILELAPEEPSETFEAPVRHTSELTEVVQSVEITETVAPTDSDQLDNMGEEQFLSVFEEVEDRADSVAAEATGSQSSTSTPDFGPLSFRPSNGAPPRETPPIGMPAESRPRFVRPGDRLGPTAPTWPSVAPLVTPAPEPVMESAPEVLDPPAAPAQGIFSEEIIASGPAPTASSAVGRTLKCSECGAMNRPLEWYCEKCGAELTAV